LITSALIFVLALAGIAIAAATEFNGDCISFEPPIQACSLGRYLIQAVVLTIIAAPFTHSFVFFFFLFVILGFPIAGLVTGRSRAKTSANS
jgi:hypothetical protein